jgi:hypothetical protein
MKRGGERYTYCAFRNTLQVLGRDEGCGRNGEDGVELHICD